MEHTLSQRVAQIQPSATLVMSAKAKDMKAAGEDVLNFSAGEPDFDVAPHIQEAATQAIKDNFSYYTASAGMPELKQAIVEKMDRENNISCTQKNVIVTNGGKEGLFLLLQAIIEDGDEVIVPTPYWVSYDEQIRYAGGVFVPMQTDSAFHFTVEDIEKVITSKTKAIILNSPSNPTGAVIPTEELEKLAELVKQRDLWVISDEVYEHFLYDGRTHTSIASFPDMFDQAVVVNAASKTYCMTGWRIGYLVGPEDIIAPMARLKSHLSSNANSIAQKAALAALNGPQDMVEEMRYTFDERRLALWKGINEIDGCALEKPEGAFYGFIDATGAMGKTGIKSSMEFCETLLEKEKMAVVPGEAFGEQYKNYIRFSFASATEDIQRGIERLARFVQ